MFACRVSPSWLRNGRQQGLFCRTIMKIIFLLTAVLIHLGAGDHSDPDMVAKNVIAIHGQSVMLECSVKASLENCLISWQWSKTKKVVHSYYYNNNQPGVQDPQYAGRTTLFREEFKNGNASLKLDRVNSLDSGVYQCYTSCNGTHESLLLNVTVAAYYDEPVLSIKQKSSSCVLTFETHGLPVADISWYSGDSLNRSLSAERVFRTSDDGLYTIQSSTQVAIREKTNYTFVLRNAALNQTILRTLSFTSENPTGANEFTRNHVFFISCILLLGLLFIFLFSYTCTKLEKIQKDHTVLGGLADDV